MDDTTQLISAIGSLLAAVAWPVLVALLLLRFRGPIAAFLSDVGEFTFKAFGVEASMKRRRQVEAAAAVAVAQATRPGVSVGPVDLRLIADTVLSTTSRREADHSVEGSRVLWVDDDPSGNTFERQALSALGIVTEVSTSTEDAEQVLARSTYDLVISDMGRPGDDQAGYTLLGWLRDRHDRTPYVIYAGSDSPEYQTEARRRGAVGSTNAPQELLRLVVEGLTRR